VDLQVLRHEELRVKAQQNTQHEFLRETVRGDILDANRNQLATSVFVKTVCADLTLVGNRKAEIAKAIAPILQLNEGELYQRLLPRSVLNKKGQPVPLQSVRLKRKVSVETWQTVQTAMSKLSFGLDEKKLSKAEQAFYRNLRAKAIFADRMDDQLRVYPNQSGGARARLRRLSERSQWQHHLGNDGQG
jgi:cell division protein FtsI/penicillin-binding protein 2